MDAPEEISKFGGVYPIRSVVNNPHNLPEYGILVENNTCNSSDNCTLGLYCNNENICRPCYEDYISETQSFNDMKCNGGWTDVQSCVAESIIQVDSSYNTHPVAFLAENMQSIPYQYITDRIIKDQLTALINSGDCHHLPYHIMDDLKHDHAHHILNQEYVDEYKNICDYYKLLHLEQYKTGQDNIYTRCSTSDDCVSDNMKCFNNHCIPNPCDDNIRLSAPQLYEDPYQAIMTSIENNMCNNDDPNNKIYIEQISSECPPIRMEDKEDNGYFFQYNTETTLLGIGYTECKNNYSGTPNITCDNNQWNIIGCNPNSCSLSDHIGYQVSNPIGQGTIGDLGNIDCSQHYNGVAHVKCSSNNGIFEFSGCTI